MLNIDMKISFWFIGKSTPEYINEGIKTYEKRLPHYCSFETICFPQVKNASKLPPNELKKKEAEMIMEKILKSDYFVSLDEYGKEYRSIEFANQLEKWSISITGRIVFLVGGAFGIDETLLSRSDHKLALGKGTYSHQLIRIMFLEQLYRGFSILKGENYHNE